MEDLRLSAPGYESWAYGGGCDAQGSECASGRGARNSGVGVGR